MIRVTILGAGNIGQALAGMLGARPELEVRAWGRRWRSARRIALRVDGRDCVYAVGDVQIEPDLCAAVHNADLVISTVPTSARAKVLGEARSELRNCQLLLTWEGTGRFREELADLGLTGLVAAGLQRSPIFSRVRRDANRVEILGVRSEVVAAATNPESYRTVKQLLPPLLPFTVTMAPCYDYVSLSPSNQLIHPARVFSAAHSRYAIGRKRRFYADWDDDASELLLALHKETKAVGIGLGLVRRFHQTLWDGPLRHTPRSLTQVHRHARALAELTLPLRRTLRGVQLDYQHRFFEEDIGHGLSYLLAVSERVGIAMPRAQEICEWYRALSS